MKKLILLIMLSITVIMETGAGYSGTLPDVEEEFAYMRKNKSEKGTSPYTIEELDKKNEKHLKPAPRFDDNYIDIIIKQDKTSKYINDLNSVIIILEKLRKCLNTDRSIQMFNAGASNLIDNIEYIRKEYSGKKESSSVSYNKMLLLSKHIRETASFWMQGNAVIKYKPYTSEDNIYTKENLESKEDF